MRKIQGMIDSGIQAAEVCLGAGAGNLPEFCTKSRAMGLFFPDFRY